MKIRNALLLLIAFSSLNSISNGAENNNLISSLIYKSNGQLIVDTNFRITKNQLLKFTRIENKLTKNILDSLKIAPVLLENGIWYEVIVSFTVDEHSCFSNLHIEKFPQWENSKREARTVSEFAKYMFLNAIMENSCKFRKDGFKSDKKKCEKYFLPIKFETNETNNNFAEIKDGWLLYKKIQPPIHDHPVE